MVVEMAMPAILPGALVAVHYALQVFRPAWGHGSDLGARRTPWIVGGMAALATGGLMASVATAWMTTHPLFGIALAVFAFCLIGVGVGAAGTSLLLLLAKRTDDSRRAPAATIVWVMMIAGFIATTGVAGHLLDPFSSVRLIIVSGSVSAAAMVLTIIGVWGVEGESVTSAEPVSKQPERQASFRDAFLEVWTEPKSRRFAIFVFVSMLAYSAQDLILEPFAGVVFGFTPGETTKLSGVQHAGTLIGMALVPLIGAVYPRSRGNLQIWTVGGCLASAIALLCLAAAAVVGPSWPLRETVFMLGVTNGAYAVAAIGSMMALVAAGGEKREGVRMGLWGAAQAFAFGIGGFLGTLASDIARYVLTSAALSYSAVFASEAGLFVVAAVMAVWVHRAPARSSTRPSLSGDLPAAAIAEGALS
jgi:BCD family chlorophyll transporter-like MFS transporter